MRCFIITRVFFKTFMMFLTIIILWFIDKHIGYLFYCDCWRDSTVLDNKAVPQLDIHCLIPKWDNNKKGHYNRWLWSTYVWIAASLLNCMLYTGSSENATRLSVPLRWVLHKVYGDL